ncbi:hypothetical protein HYV72_01170 [Candidatus Uhrbacteria bacterium]|nr:hypothetical protein [Candidatus Uhrbacteria bacterium]
MRNPIFGHVTPVLFVASAIGFMLFLETQWVLVTVSVAVAIFVAFYLEHVFRFVHAPGLYQPYALEHTSIVLHVASVYFFSTVFYGLNTFLHIPVWILAVLFFILSSVFVFETLWVSKIASNIAISRALLGGLLLM